MPVDIAKGVVRTGGEEARIPGRVPLVWDRLYSTARLDQQPTPLGHGWTSRYFATLTPGDGEFVFVTPEGTVEVIEDPEHAVDQGGVARNLGAFHEIFKHDDRFIVQRWNVDTGEVERFCFYVGARGVPAALMGIEDVTGQGLDVLWDADGRLISVEQRLERRILKLSYGTQGLIERVRLIARDGGEHVLARYEYDSQGRSRAAFDAAHFGDRYDYDAAGRLTREVVKDGGVFTYRYDARGRCIRTSGLNRYQHRTLRFLDAASFTEVIDSYGQTSRYQHLPSGQIVRAIDPLGAEQITQYDEHGRIVAKIDPTKAETRYGYDDRGNRNIVTDALGNTCKLFFNDAHLPVRMQDPRGNTWLRGYDEWNRLTWTANPLGQRWSLQYDEAGNVLTVRNPRGDIQHQEFDHGELTAVTDWMGHVTRFRVDGLGRVIERVEPLGELTRARYDRMGHLVEAILPNGTVRQASYDQAGNLTAFIDGNGHAYSYRYGPCSRLLERVDPTGASVRYAWGSERGRLEAVINENGESYVFSYDEAGRVVRERGFDGAERLVGYDSAGYVSAYTNANGEKIGIHRDALHHVVGLSLPNGERATFSYDAAGALTEAVNAVTSVTFERDACGRILRDVQGDAWVHHRYDPVGNITGTATSAGHLVDYDIDPNGNIAKLTTLAQSLKFEYRWDGGETLRESSAGAILLQQFDALGRLIEQRVGRRMGADTAASVAQGTTISRAFSYDRDRSLISIEDGHWGRVDYVYDPAERVLEAIRDLQPSERFSYTPTGSVATIRADEAQLTDEVLVYGPGNRLLEKGSTRYEYDAEGRRTRKIEDADTAAPRTWQYEWDALDRLRSVTRPDGAVWKYKYDALARRVEKEGPGGNVRFLWDRSVVSQELRGSQPHSAWIFDPRTFRPIATVQHARLYSVITDHIGTPKELIDGSGFVVWSVASKLWGEPTTTRKDAAADVDCPVRFQGQWRDVETGLTYNRYRYYDPEVGAFISQDPTRLLGGENLYLYARNPTGWADPLGLVAAPASLPNEPGIYIVRNGDQSYVGSAGMGSGDGAYAQGMQARLSSSSDPGQALLGEGATVRYIKVDLGTATSRSDRNNILRYYEAREYDKEVAAGYTMLNKNRPQAASKTEKAEKLIEEHEASASSRRRTCKG